MSDRTDDDEAQRGTTRRAVLEAAGAASAAGALSALVATGAAAETVDPRPSGTNGRSDVFAIVEDQQGRPTQTSL